ncbi:MAG TPA: PIN domain-containing protein [Pyrinomonadaceae bacterium]|jgi:predicted nucleic acid-binding protein
MRVLLDTDVVLDHLLNRAPFAQAAGELLKLSAEGVFDGYVSGITPINIFYIARKVMGRDRLRQALNDLLFVVRVCPINHSILASALTLPFTDYEDAVQCASAMASQLDAIVTRNPGDFKNAALPVFSPTDFLNKLKSQPT